jgi:hypothetical protein
VLTATGEVPVSRYRRRNSHDGDADQDFANAIHLGFYHIAERPPSADRSQQILNSAGRHRDSAARLCSAYSSLL